MKHWLTYIPCFVFLIAMASSSTKTLPADITHRGLDSIVPDSGYWLTRLRAKTATYSGPPVDVYTFAPFAWGYAATSPDGSYLASAGYDGVCLWQMETGTQLRCYRIEPGPLVFDHEGDKVMVTKGPSNRDQIGTAVYNLGLGDPLAESSVSFVSVLEDSLVQTLQGKYGDAFSAAISPEGGLLYVGHYNKIVVWDLHTRKVVREFSCRGVAFALFPEQDMGLCSPQFSNILASSGGDAEDYSIRTVSLHSGVESSRFRGATQPVTSAQFTHDGTLLYSASRDGRVREYDAATGQLKKTITVVPQPKPSFVNSVGDTIEGIRSFFLMPNNRYAVISHEPHGASKSATPATGQTAVWDLKQGIEVRSLDEAEEPLSIGQPGGQQIIATSTDDITEARIINVDDGKVQQRYRGFAVKQTDVHVLEPDKLLYSAGRHALLLDLRNADATPILLLKEYSETFVSKQGNRAIVVDSAGPQEGFNYGKSTLHVTSARWVPDQSVAKPIVAEFEISSRRMGKVWHQGEFHAAMVGLAVTSVSPDGRLIVTMSEDDVLQLWDADTGKQVREIRHRAWSTDAMNAGCGLADAAISPSGRFFDFHRGTL